MDIWIHPLWAAGRDWIATLILLVFVLLPAIGQFISKLFEAQKEAARRAARQAQGGGVPAGRGGQDPIEREIAEFLRRVTGQPDRPKSRQAPAQPRGGPRPLAQEPAGRRPVRPGPKPSRRAAPRPSSAPPVLAEGVPEAPLGQGVGKQAEQFLRTEELEAQTAQLGSALSQIDQKLEARLREKFDRELQDMGRLPSGPSDVSLDLPGGPADTLGMEAMYGVPSLPATVGTGLTSLLATAESVREAIILYEILQPSWQRWGEVR